MKRNQQMYDDKCWGNCEYSEYNTEYGCYVCVCQESDNYSLPTEFGDRCRDFEVRE